MFFSVDLVETFVHALSFVVDGAVTFEFLLFESGFFAHDCMYFFEQHAIFPLNFGKPIFMQHVFFLIVDKWIGDGLKGDIDVGSQGTSVTQVLLMKDLNTLLFAALDDLVSVGDSFVHLGAGMRKGVGFLI